MLVLSFKLFGLPELPPLPLLPLPFLPLPRQRQLSNRLPFFLLRTAGKMSFMPVALFDLFRPIFLPVLLWTVPLQQLLPVLLPFVLLL